MFPSVYYKREMNISFYIWEYTTETKWYNRNYYKYVERVLKPSLKNFVALKEPKLGSFNTLGNI